MDWRRDTYKHAADNGAKREYGDALEYSWSDQLPTEQSHQTG